MNDASSGIPELFKHNREILAGILGCLNLAIASHCKVFVVRLDIRFPEGTAAQRDNAKISELIRRLQAHYGYQHVKLYYLWAREQNSSTAPHYHVILFLNGSRINSGWSVQRRAGEIWSSLMETKCSACVNLGRANDGSTGIMIYRPGLKSVGEKRRFEEVRFNSACQVVLIWARYLAKTHTKGNAPHRVREFGSTRISSSALNAKKSPALPEFQLC